MYRMNASGPVGQTGGMNIHINPYDQSYLYSTTSSGINSGHISLSSPYSTGTGGVGGHIYSGGTTLNRHMATSNSGHHSSLTNGNGPVSACSSGNLALNQPPSTSLLHSVTSSQSAVAAAVTASTAPPGAMATASSMTTTGSSAFGGQIHASQISSSPGTQLTGRTNSTHGITSNLLHSHSSSSSSPHHHSHPHTHHHQQASSSTQSPSVVFNGGPSMVTMVNGTSASGMVNGSVSNSNNNSTHQMLPSTLDTSSPSDAPQKKTFYVLIILIAIGITVMVITVITAIVIFFKYSEKIDLVHKKPLASSGSHLNRDSNKVSSSSSVGFDSNGDAQDPCTKLSCHQHGMDCTIDSSTSEASCFCPITICPPYKLPVCGSDGITYESECHFIKNKCLLLHSYLYPSSTSSLQLASSQALQLSQQSSVDSDANSDLILEAAPANELPPPKSSELTAVPFVFDPGQSKINLPAALGTGNSNSKSNLPNVIKITSQVTSPVNLTIVSRGSCPSDACNNVTCPFNGICHSQPGLKELVTCQCPDCPEVHSPVCGSDGTTYVNECFVRKQSCKNQMNITVRHEGYCKGCQEITCPHYSKCQFDVRSNLAECICPNEPCVRTTSANESSDSEQLTKYYDQMVCASDGQTYSSLCQMERKSCEAKVTIKVLYYGPCDPCKDVKCNFGASCKDGQCICPTDCPDLIEPVCVKSALVNAYGNQDKQLTIHHNPKQVSGTSVASLSSGDGGGGGGSSSQIFRRKSYNYQSECEMRSSACKNEIQLDYDSLIYGTCPDDSNDHNTRDNTDVDDDDDDGDGKDNGEDDDQVISSTVASGRKFQWTNKSSSNIGTSNSGNDATDQLDPARVNVLSGFDSNNNMKSISTDSASSSPSSSSVTGRNGIMNKEGRKEQRKQQSNSGKKDQGKMKVISGTYSNGGKKKTTGNGKFVDESSDPLEHTSGQLPSSSGKMKPVIYSSLAKTNENDDDDVVEEDAEDDLDEDESDEEIDHTNGGKNLESNEGTFTTSRVSLPSTGHKDTNDELVDHTDGSNSRRIIGKKKYGKVTPSNLNIAASREDDEDELSSNVNGKDSTGTIGGGTDDGDEDDGDGDGDSVTSIDGTLHGNNNNYNKGGGKGQKVSSKVNSRPNNNRNKFSQIFPNKKKHGNGNKNKSSTKGPKGKTYPSSPASSSTSSSSSSSIFSFAPSPLAPTVSTNGSSSINRQLINSKNDQEDDDDEDEIDELINADDVDDEDEDEDEFDEDDDENDGNNNSNSKTINFSFKDNRIGEWPVDLTDDKLRSLMEVECRKLNCPIGAMCKLKSTKSSTSSSSSSVDGKSVQTYCDCDLMCVRIDELNLDTPEWKLKGPVCASNGILYPNECQFHRANCLIEYSSSSPKKQLTVVTSVNSCTVNFTSINSSSSSGNGKSKYNGDDEHSVRHSGHRGRGNNNKLDGQLNNNNIKKEDEYAVSHNNYHRRVGNGRGQSLLGHGGDNLDPRGLEEDDSDDEDDLDESLDGSSWTAKKGDSSSSSSSSCPCNKYGSLNPDCSDISSRIRRPYPPYYHGLVNGTTFQGSPVSSLSSLSSNSPLPQCICRPGVGGKYCDRCNPDYWGLHKILSHNVPGCLPCDCNVNGSVRSDCEQMTGRCVCKPGVLGIKCDECPSGRILTVYGCTDESIFRPVPKSCSQMVCLFGARCREMKDHHHHHHHHLHHRPPSTSATVTSASNNAVTTSKDHQSLATNSFTSNSSPSTGSAFDRSNSNNNNNNNSPTPNSSLLTSATFTSTSSSSSPSPSSSSSTIANSSITTTRAQCVCDGLCDPLTSSSSSSSAPASSLSSSSFSLHSTLPSLGWYSSPSIDVHESPSDQSLLLQSPMVQQLATPLVLTSLSNVNNGNKNLLYSDTPDPSVITSHLPSPSSSLPVPLSPLYTWWVKNAIAFNSRHFNTGHRLKRSNSLSSEVCGSNGITYPSECELRLHSCRIQESIIVVSKGPCKNAY